MLSVIITRAPTIAALGPGQHEGILASLNGGYHRRRARGGPMLALRNIPLLRSNCVAFKPKRTWEDVRPGNDAIVSSCANGGLFHIRMPETMIANDELRS